MAERPVRTIDHVVHAVTDLDAAADQYASLGFTVTPRADHPFGTANRLVVLERSYVEVVAVTDPERLPEAGFAARVASRLRSHGPGLTHVVLSSEDPPADLASLGPAATGEIFAFSRPAPQPDGTVVMASFECTLMHGTADLGMFLCKHLVPGAVWNTSTTRHANAARAVTALTLPIDPDTVAVLGMAAGADAEDGVLMFGGTTLRSATRTRITFDVPLPRTDICGVTVAGS